MLQRHDLVTLLGERPFKSHGNENIEILNQGFKFDDEKVKEIEGEGAAATEGGAAPGDEVKRRRKLDPRLKASTTRFQTNFDG